ncbi:hypothetical protein [Cohnella sp. WQ 127256]|uniref:hypothetical protein n=1 Tax=Cohnella sp. WQ 127256 TaxID=2938790 RepID=UPI0021191EE5|nr:hypothetical protein [Cohnella sp. WQ 127256]
MIKQSQRIIMASLLSSFTAIYSLTDISYLFLSLPSGVLIIFGISYYALGKLDWEAYKEQFLRFRHFKLVLVLTALSLFAYCSRIKSTLHGFLPNSTNTYVVVGLLLLLIMILTINYFMLWYVLVSKYLRKLISFGKKLDLFDRSLIYGYIILFAIVNLIVLLRTSAFIFPMSDGSIAGDVIFNTDTAELLYPIDGFTTPNSSENDFRQLLFGIIGFPLSMICTPLAYVIQLFVESSGAPIPFETIYGYLISIGQAGMFAISAILIKKMLSKEMNLSFARLFAVVYLVSFSTFIFTMTIEQYALSTFTLVIFVYLFVRRADGRSALVVAGSTLTSSFAMLPLVVFDKKADWRSYLVKAFKMMFATFCVIVFFGQLYELLSAVHQLFAYSQYAYGESITQWDKLLYYVQFIPSLFIAPDSLIVDGIISSGEASGFQYVLGITIFLLSCLSLSKLKRSRLALISVYWVFISLLLIGIIGWGVVEQSFVLYTSYFAWAFLISLALIFNDLFKNRQQFGKVVLSLIILILVVSNSLMITDYVMKVGSFN